MSPLGTEQSWGGQWPSGPFMHRFQQQSGRPCKQEPWVPGPLCPSQGWADQLAEQPWCRCLVRELLESLNDLEEVTSFSISQSAAQVHSSCSPCVWAPPRNRWPFPLQTHSSLLGWLVLFLCLQLSTEAQGPCKQAHGTGQESSEWAATVHCLFC